MKINIVGGSGVMGRVHSRVFEYSGHKTIITGRSSEVSPESAAKECDITIISVPLSATEETIKKVAPHAKAIVDFSSVKIKPIEWMKKYSSQNSEVAGLHPLYGEADSIKCRSIVFCKTEKTGKNCLELVEILKKAGGAKIIEISPEEHDLYVNGIAQNVRTILLESFGKMVLNKKIDIKKFYDISPPPTKIILDLLARQANEANDEMYSSMKKLNPLQEELNKEIKKILEETILKQNPAEIRDFFGEAIKSAQQRADKRIDKE